ncbi:hypothetical protein N0V88_000319 [Collariella sp. IMI 366227]|nr:hypothetical protein N0V88_000319 [Collariella sp. IMI 366227]
MATVENAAATLEALAAVPPEPTTSRADPPADAGSDSEPTPPPNKPEPKLCGVCGIQPGKYNILLDHRPAFTRLFEKYPHLPAELSRIQATTLPPSTTPQSQD